MKKKNKIALMITSIVLLLAVAGGLLYYFLAILPEQQRRADQERLMKEYYQNKISSYEEENEKYSDFEVDIAFLGDSLTDGYDLEKYYQQYKTANRGIAGETTHGLEKRLKVSVYDLKPKVVVMLIGGNNLSTMFENYEQILIGLKENLPSTKVVLVSLTAMGRNLASKNSLACLNNVKIEKMAEKYSFEFVDVFYPLFNPQTNEIFEEYTNDGAHFTSAGYDVVTDAITPVLDKLF